MAATGFELVVPDDVPESRLPTADELELIATVIDPEGARFREVPELVPVAAATPAGGAIRGHSGSVR